MEWEQQNRARRHGEQEQEQMPVVERVRCPTEQEQEHGASCCPGTPTPTVLPPSPTRKRTVRKFKKNIEN